MRREGRVRRTEWQTLQFQHGLTDCPCSREFQSASSKVALCIHRFAWYHSNLALKWFSNRWRLVGDLTQLVATEWERPERDGQPMNNASDKSGTLSRLLMPNLDCLLKSLMSLNEKASSARTSFLLIPLTFLRSRVHKSCEVKTGPWTRVSSRRLPPPLRFSKKRDSFTRKNWWIP